MSAGNWGRWGAADEVGAGNFVDRAAVLRGTGVVREGRVLSLAQPLGPSIPVPRARRPPARYMERTAGDYAGRDEPVDAFHFAEDTVVLPMHTGTHLDALAHVWAGQELYNGHPADAIQARRGAARCGAEHLAPTVSRGLLLDFVADGEQWVEADRAIGAQDLAAACARAGVEPAPGDAILLRTGWWDRHGADPDTYFYTSPGLAPDGASWLAVRDPAVIGADNCAIEALPFPRGTVFPVHLILIHQHGIPLLENLSLSDLAAADVSEFLFIGAPLALQGSTASPLNPLAVI